MLSALEELKVCVGYEDEDGKRYDARAVSPVGAAQGEAGLRDAARLEAPTSTRRAASRSCRPRRATTCSSSKTSRACRSAFVGVGPARDQTVVLPPRRRRWLARLVLGGRCARARARVGAFRSPRRRRSRSARPGTSGWPSSASVARSTRTTRRGRRRSPTSSTPIWSSSAPRSRSSAGVVDACGAAGRPRVRVHGRGRDSSKAPRPG